MDTGDLSGTRETDTRFAKHLDIHKIRLDSSGHMIVGKGKRKEYMTPISIGEYAFGHAATADVKATLKVRPRRVDSGLNHILPTPQTGPVRNR